MKRVTLVGPLLALTGLAVAGCSSPSQPVSPPPVEATPTSAASASPSASEAASPTPSASPSSSSDASCLAGAYTMAKFEGKGLSDTVLTATGTDVTITFKSGEYTFKGTGRPYELKGGKADETGQLIFDGTLNGTYKVKGSSVTYTPGKATGEVTLKAEGQSRSAPMQQVSRSIAPHGTATVSCDVDAATISMPEGDLSLEKK